MHITKAFCISRKELPMCFVVRGFFWVLVVCLLGGVIWLVNFALATAKV